MKLSYNWLKDYLKCDLDPAQVAATMTATTIRMIESMRLAMYLPIGEPPFDGTPDQYIGRASFVSRMFYLSPAGTISPGPVLCHFWMKLAVSAH